VSLASKGAAVTYLIIIVNIIVFLTSLPNPKSYNQLIQTYGLVPVQIMGGKNLFTLVTSMFLHSDIIHIGLNIFFQFVTGDAVERELGSSRFFALYLACGIIAGLFHSYLNSTSSIPTIGASGAIFGVIAAFAILFPSVGSYPLGVHSNPSSSHHLRLHNNFSRNRLRSLPSRGKCGPHSSCGRLPSRSLLDLAIHTQKKREKITSQNRVGTIWCSI
jgi:hypothetical protein